MIYKTSHRKLNREQHEHHFKPGVNPGATKRQAFPAPLDSRRVTVQRHEHLLI